MDRTSGFSGAAVVDSVTGEVIGLVGLEGAIRQLGRQVRELDDLPPGRNYRDAFAQLQQLAESVEVNFAQVRESLAEQRKAQEEEAKQAVRSGRRLFWLGLILGVPFGLLGSLIAFWIGIS